MTDTPTPAPPPSRKFVREQARRRAIYEAARADWKRRNPDRPREDSK